MKISLTVARFVCLLTLLCLVSPPLAAADDGQLVKVSNPLYGRFRPVTVDCTLGFEIEFNGKMIVDKELIFKQLDEAERPFDLSWPVEMKVFWKSEKIIRLEPVEPLDGLEAKLEKKYLDLTWKNIKDFEGRKLEYVMVAGDGARRDLGYLVFNETRKKNGRIYNRIELMPFAVEFKQWFNGSTHQVSLRFNRMMISPGSRDQALAIDEAPVTFEPPLPFKARWQDQHTLLLSQTMKRDELWNIYSDVKYKMTWKGGLKNIHGTEFAPYKAVETFEIMTFGAPNLNQAAMGLDGWAEYDLAFNKPVDLEAVRNALTVEKAVFDAGRTIQIKSDEKAASHIPAQFQIKAYEGPGENDGTVVRVRVKADNGERLVAKIRNLASADGRGRISSRNLTSWVDNFFTVANTNLNIEENFPWRSFFTINTRESLRFDDIEKYIRLEPSLKFTVSPYGQEGSSIQIFADFSPETETKITLLRGLRSQRGVLTEDVSFTARLPRNADRKLMFTGRGRYLSPANPLLIKLAGRNVGKVRLQAWRVYENNLPTIINVQDYDQKTRLRLTQQFSKNILDRESETKAPAGRTFERLIDLAQVFDETPKGAYLLKCTPVKEENQQETGEDEYYEDDYYYDPYYDYSDYYRNPQRYLPVMVSDIGLAAHALPGKVSVWANSLSETRPVAGGRVKYYDKANQIIAEGKTDSDGLFTAEANLADLVFATVEKDGDLNYLVFGSAQRSSAEVEDDYDEYSDYNWYESGDTRWYAGDGGYLPVNVPTSSFGPERHYLTRGYEAFVYLPRDIYKPGETVQVKALVRDKNILPPAETFPVLWRVSDPDGRVLSQGKADMNKHGALDFAVEIPFSGRTGSYQAEVSLPGSSAVLGRVKFTVEDFVPPRLALEVAAAEKLYYGENPEIILNSSATYLFGAPGAELNWELDAVVFPSAFNPKGWDGFDFSGRPSDFRSTSQRRAAKGKLDENGQAVITYQPSLEAERLPNKTSIEFVFSAQEDGGRWNAKKTRVDYFPRPMILGLKPPQEATVETPFTIEIAAVTPEGTAAETPELKVEFFRVMSRYYNSYRYGRHYRQSVEELVEQSAALVPLDNGRGLVQFTPESSGAYDVRVTDAASGEYINKRVYVYGLAETKEAVSAKGPVEIVLDRENYRPGDKAKVKIKSPFPGRLWLTLETDELLYSASAFIKDKEIELTVPVDKSIKANARLTATVVRPLGGKAKTFRAMGHKSLEIDRDIYKLNVGAEMPERIKPSAPVKVKIKLSDEKGRPVAGEASVALVDEGILSLTAFKTPDPWKMFTVGRSLATKFYDLYEQLLPLEDAAVPFLAPGGGDGLGRSGLFSPFKRNQELLSIFKTSVEVGPNGLGEVELNLPEYSGQGRLMVVASSRDRFGSAEADIRISRDLTAEATVPLALAPDDVFELSVRVFLAAEAPAESGRGAALVFKTEGPLSLIDQDKAEFDLEPGQGETLIVKARAHPALDSGPRAGIGRLIIESRDGSGEVFSQSIETVVRPPYPRVAKTVSAQVVEDETGLTISSDGFLAGTVEASLTLAKGPSVEAARAISYLRSYPYGCLEQTTSGAWPFVAAEDILSGLESEVFGPNHIETGLKTAVQRLATMQTPSGGFAYWPGGRSVYEWGSVYAVHFLTEAEKRIELPQGLKERGLNWLENYLSAGYGSSSDDAAYILSTRAYALFVLALNGNYKDGWVNALKDRYEGLSPSARIFLTGAQSLHQGHAQALEALEKEKMDLSYNSLRSRVSSLDSLPRNTALKLLVWSEVAPLSETTNSLAWAVAEQGRQGQWSNTQENGMAVLALGRYLTKSGLGRRYRATLSDSAGRTIFTAGNKDIGAAGKNVLAGLIDQPLTLSVEGEGRPYYSLTVAGVPLSPPEPVAEGLSLRRWWVFEDGSEIELSAPGDLAKPLTVTKGDRVVVVIELQAAEPIQNAVLVDILPGGFEIENHRLVQPGDETDEDDDEGEDEDLMDDGSRLELREDRLVMIEPWLGGGWQRYSYTLRAVTTGDYVLPGTAAEGMYEPSRRSILPGGFVSVR